MQLREQKSSQVVQRRGTIKTLSCDLTEGQAAEGVGLVVMRSLTEAACRSPL
jgi:hypothetical protein